MSILIVHCRGLFRGTTELRQALQDAGVDELDVTESSQTVRIVGSSTAGAVSLALLGLTPNSLFTTGEYVPLVARFHVLRQEIEPTVFAARSTNRGVAQLRVNGRERCAVLSALEPMSPLNRLTVTALRGFLTWSAGLLSPNPAQIRSTARRAWERNRNQLERNLSLSGFRMPWRGERTRDQALLVEIQRLLKVMARGRDPEVRRGGARGGLGLLRSYRSELSQLESCIEIDVFRFSSPKATLALDDFRVDIQEIENAAALLPVRWIALRVHSSRMLELQKLQELHAFEQARYFGAWASAEQVEEGWLAEQLEAIEQQLMRGVKGPYR